MVEKRLLSEAAGLDDETNFIKNMQRLRERRGVSQGAFAKKMQEAGWTSFHQTTVSRIEKGTRPVRLGESRGIAAALGSSVDQMIQSSDGLEAVRALEERTAEAVSARFRIYAHIQELQLAQGRVFQALRAVEEERDSTNSTLELRDTWSAVHKAKDVLHDNYVIDIIDDLRVRYGLNPEKE